MELPHDTSLEVAGGGLALLRRLVTAKALTAAQVNDRFLLFFVVGLYDFLA